MIWLLILKAFYFFLPAYFANMAPVILKWIPFLEIPVYKKKLGPNKTWRGVVVAILLGGFVFWLQKIAYLQGFTSLAIIDYADFPILLGFVMGLGAIVGDLVGSYYKRKRKIPPGRPWLPWDQLDFVLGAVIFGFIVYVPSAEVLLILIVGSPILHLVFNYLGYLLKLKKNKI